MLLVPLCELELMKNAHLSGCILEIHKLFVRFNSSLINGLYDLKHVLLTSASSEDEPDFDKRIKIYIRFEHKNYLLFCMDLKWFILYFSS